MWLADFNFSCVFSELKARVRELEHENADIRFLNNQYVHKVRAIEKESKTKTDKILQLQEKNFHAVVQTPGGNFFLFSYFSKTCITVYWLSEVKPGI